MRFVFFTLFPELIAAGVNHGVLRKAVDTGSIQVQIVDVREFGIGNHHQVDDTPCGGGAGMILRYDVVLAAVQSAQLASNSMLLLLDPRGTRFNQHHAARLKSRLMEPPMEMGLVCGHYGGVDDRVRTHLSTETVSVGDFVVTGGELPALCVFNAVARLVPGVLGNQQSLEGESFDSGLLSAPAFTRPLEHAGHAVPSVLLSGDHQKIRKWKRERALKLTYENRPDLLAHATLETGDADLLQ